MSSYVSNTDFLMLNIFICYRSYFSLWNFLSHRETGRYRKNGRLWSMLSRAKVSSWSRENTKCHLFTFLQKSPNRLSHFVVPACFITDFSVQLHIYISLCKYSKSMQESLLHQIIFSLIYPTFIICYASWRQESSNLYFNRCDSSSVWHFPIGLCRSAN